YLTANIQQRAAAVAGIDGGVGLQEMLELLRSGQIAAGGADNAGGDGGLEAKGRSDSNGPISHHNAIGVADLHRVQRALGIDLQYGKIGFGIVTDDLRAILFILAVQLHANTVSLFDDVIVGQDIAVLIDNKAGAGTLFAKRTRLRFTEEFF